jgi:hypothetical protein
MPYHRARYYHPHLRRFLNEDPVGFDGGLNWYAYAEGNPVTGIDPVGLWNLWNPLTWGLPSNPDENPYNPFDSSGEWSATTEGAKKGAAAYADGIIPFVDPFKDAGVYDVCRDKGTNIALWLGANVGRDALLTITGAGIASKFSGPLSRLPLVGKGGQVFGRAGFGGQSVLDAGAVRTGWGWNGARDVFRVSWSTPGNRTWWNHFDIF